MYINKVGEEEKAMRKRMRRYNMEYDPLMPMVDVLISRLAEADIGGIGGGFERRALYGAMMEIRGNNVPAIVDCRNDTFETIIGREVLNKFVIILDGKGLNIEIRDP